VGEERGTSFVELLRHLVGETVRVAADGATTVRGKLVGVHTSFIALAVCDHTHREDGGEGDRRGHTVHNYWIPVHQISAISEL
jgi:small nuclear ribonucleoprotein (snRNP)-like protein